MFCTFKDILFFDKELILNSDFFNCLASANKTKTNPHVSSELSIGGYLLFGFFGLKQYFYLNNLKIVFFD